MNLFIFVLPFLAHACGANFQYGSECQAFCFSIVARPIPSKPSIDVQTTPNDQVNSSTTSIPTAGTPGAENSNSTEEDRMAHLRGKKIIMLNRNDFNAALKKYKKYHKGNAKEALKIQGRGRFERCVVLCPIPIVRPPIQPPFLEPGPVIPNFSINDEPQPIPQEESSQPDELSDEIDRKRGSRKSKLH